MGVTPTDAGAKATSIVHRHQIALNFWCAAGPPQEPPPISENAKITEKICSTLSTLEGEPSQRLLFQSLTVALRAAGLMGAAFLTPGLESDKRRQVLEAGRNFFAAIRSGL
jgi:hypothetical protein